MRLGKLRKATIGFVVNVLLSAWNNSAPTGRIFMKFDIWVFSETLSRKTRFIKSSKNNVYCTRRPAHIYDHFSLSWSYNEKCFRQICRENKNTYFVCNKFLFRKPCHLWDNAERYCRAGQATDGNSMRRMCISWSISNATHTHTQNK